MENAIVCGAMHFVGFELCKQLLNRGCSVVAIDHGGNTDKYHVEKWLEIGRNANLLRLPIEEIRDEIDSSVVCFIPYIDFLSLPDKFNGLFNDVESLLQMENITEYHIIFPSKYHFSFSDTNRRNFNAVFPITNMNKKVVEYYVPTLYGPWQPNTYLFQQLIEGKCQDDYLDDTMDAIFIEDAVKEIVDNTQQTEHRQRILIRNMQPDMWRKCVLYLKEDFKVPPKKHVVEDRDMVIKNIQECHSFQESLKIQIECFKRFQNDYSL
ncbi:hypothetical protein [Heyndrickxia camelliae]|uniref:UDP-glucose 4-epimerase n=1 Tax=Heyndrickxia camelliae TaxID=1707093 RepID=A0A2N3LQ02_9BACI|nr:hypothetical protein [Heyndrickxia camelliae]PKR86752.1 hypothetical protein CWO92_01440 [Heyndrickxia camelliae]